MSRSAGEICARVPLRSPGKCRHGDERRRMALSELRSLLRHPGLVQAFEHVRVIFRPKPRRPLTDLHLEHGRRRRDGLLQRFPRFVGAAELPKCGGEPAIRIGIMGN